MRRRTTLTLLTLLAAVAFATRLAGVVHFKSWTNPNAMEHKNIAASIVAGKGFSFTDWYVPGPTSVQSPTFPYMLAGLFKAYGAVSVNQIGDAVLDRPAAERAYFAVMLLNCAAGGALVFLTYGAGRTFGADPRAALLAAGLVAVWPTQVYAAGAVQAISLITCGLLGMIILYYRAVRTGSAAVWTGFAFLGAFSALTEPVYLPVLVLSGVMVLLARPLNLRQRIRNGAILAVVTMMVIGPWTVRNYRVHGKVIPVKGSFWVNVWKGNNDHASGTDRLKMTPAEAEMTRKRIEAGESDVDVEARQYDLLTSQQQARLIGHSEAEREQVFHEFAADWISTHHARYAQLCGIRLAKTLTIDWDNPRSLSYIYLAARGAIVLMTLAGLVVAWRQRWSLLFPAVAAGCALATYTLTVTAARFSIPFEPIQLILGSAAVFALLSSASSKTSVDGRQDRAGAVGDPVVAGGGGHSTPAV